MSRCERESSSLSGDQVAWALALLVVAMLGSTTLLYLYVEVQRKLGDPEESFSP